MEDNFNFKKYLAEGRLLKEELTPLQQYVYDYEKEVSGEDNAKEFLDGIKKLMMFMIIMLLKEIGKVIVI